MEDDQKLVSKRSFVLHKVFRKKFIAFHKTKNNIQAS